MKTPLYDVLCAAIKPVRALRWNWNPETGLWFMSDFMRDRIGLRNNECYIDEVRGWLLDYDEGMKEATRQLQTSNHCNIFSTIRLCDGTIERWSGHGRIVICIRDMPAICTPHCKVQKCKILVGASEIATSLDPLPRRLRQRPDH